MKKIRRILNRLIIGCVILFVVAMCGCIKQQKASLDVDIDYEFGDAMDKAVLYSYPKEVYRYEEKIF